MTRGLALLLVALAAPGCAGQGTTRTGFLSSYEGMGPTARRTHDLIVVDPQYARAGFSRVFVEPVAWVPAPGAPERSAEEQVQLREAFRRSLVEELGKDFAVAPDATGAGTLVVRAAITNTRRANWWINVPVQAAGVGLTLAGLPGGLPPPNPGGASVEMEVLDAATGRRVAAVSIYTNGAPWAPTGYVLRFGHARRAFGLAASLLREQLVPARPG